MIAEHIPYSGALLIEGIGALYHQPGKAPLTDAWLLMKDGVVEALGQGSAPTVEHRRDVGGGVVIPAPLDAHTHLLFGGDRSDEFNSRSLGESYEQRLARGGGIHATVEATAAAHDEVLIRTALQRVQHAMHLGVRAVEVKTGYGLTIEAEDRLITLLERLRSLAPIDVYPTLLAHVPPKGSDPAAVAQGFAEHLIPRAASLGFGFDVFVEAGAFGIKEAEVMLAAAQRRNMRIHVHADQLSATGATGLAARYGAASAEHVEFASAADIEALAAAGTMANLLPGAWLQTGCATRPPVDRLRAAGVPFIVSTDLNPGSSYLYDLITAASLAIAAFGLTVDEALAAITTHPARALGVSELGGLGAGERGRPWWLPFPSAAALFQRLHAPQRGLQFVGDNA